MRYGARKNASTKMYIGTSSARACSVTM